MSETTEDGEHVAKCSLPVPKRKWEHRAYICECGRAWHVIYRELGWNCGEYMWQRVRFEVRSA